MAEPLGTLSPGPAPSWRDQLTDLIAQISGGGQGKQAWARQATGVADFVPGVGTGLAVDDTARAMEDKDWLGAVIGAAGLIPGARAGTKLGREALQGAPGTVGVKSDKPLAHGRISQRFPTSPVAPEDPLTENLLINTNVMRQDPKKMQQASDIIGTYPATTREMQEMNPDERVEAFIEQLRGNFNAMHDLMPKGARDRAGNWYEGANKLAGQRAEEVGIPLEASAGAFAALSPQKDWFQNVYLGDTVLRTLDKNPKVTPDMLRASEAIPPYTTPEARDQLASMLGRRVLNLDPREQAMAIRLHDETYSPRNYRKITPEGDYGDFATTKGGEPKRAAWGSFNEIEKAAQAAQSGGDMSQISKLMGEKHKVRNFYNSIAAPIEGQEFGDLVADTHHIGAGHFRPLTGKSKEVMQGLQSGGAGVTAPPVSAVTGMRGLYPLYADATRRAAVDQGIDVRKMQSIPWEAMRALFPPEFRSAGNQQNIDDLWRLFGQGEITADEARKRTIEAAGGFRPPNW